jgi:hypothetical protein
VRTGVNEEGRSIKYFEIDGKKEYLKEYNPIIPEAVKKKIRRDVIGIEENPNFVSKLMQKTQKKSNDKATSQHRREPEYSLLGPV